MRTSRSTQRIRGGYTLILVLLIAGACSTMAIGIYRSAAFQRTVVNNAISMAKADALAEGGVQHAAVYLRTNPDFVGASAQFRVGTAAYWFQVDSDGTSYRVVGFGSANGLIRTRQASFDVAN
ncbi:MAG: hypothetical protein R3C28_29195 [Pirellulaceae bacterium]